MPHSSILDLASEQIWRCQISLPVVGSRALRIPVAPREKTAVLETVGVARGPAAPRAVW